VSADGLPRLAFDALDPVLRDELDPTVKRLGYFGEFFQVFAAVPGAVSAFMGYTKAVKTSLADNENEVLALAVCAALGADYERIQHERLSLQLGFSHAWIAAAEGRAGDDSGPLSGDEVALRELAAIALRDHGEGCAEAVRCVADRIGPQKAAAALLQVARFAGIALLCNALSLRLPVLSPLDEASANAGIRDTTGRR